MPRGREKVDNFDIQTYQRAAELGINVTLEEEYVWVGHEFSRAGVPTPWSEYSDDHAQIFYYNHETGDSQWVHPLLDTFKALLAKCKAEPHLIKYFRALYNNLRQYCDDKKGWWALNLLLTPSDTEPPMPEEVKDMMLYLQVNHKKEPELAWIAKQAVQVPLPPNWEEHEDDQSNTYFYNKVTGKSQVKHPLDDYFFALVAEERKKIPGRRKRHPNDRTVGWMPFQDSNGVTYYVSFQYNIQTYYPPWEPRFYFAAKKIQTHVRKRQAYTRKLHLAATRIQSVYRGHVVRDAVEAWRQECAALCIQTMYRMYRARLEALNERSALTIQSCWRMYLCRREYVKQVAALRVQSGWRRVLAQRVFKREKGACTVQRIWKGVKARRRARSMIVKRDAARVVQRAERARQERKRVKAAMLMKAVLLMQSHCRRQQSGKIVRQERYKQKAGRAGIIIQAHWRRLQAQRLANQLREVRDREYGALTIQRYYRGFRARQYVKWIVESAAARVVQRVYRKHYNRVMPGRHAAATTIQRVFRGYTARKWIIFMQEKEWSEVQNAVSTIQRNWRKFHAKELHKNTLAAVFIQKLVKGRQQRDKYLTTRAACRIQSRWKGYIQRFKWKADIFRMRLVAYRMQYIFRLYQAHRSAIVERMMFEYRVHMANRIKQAWFGYQSRRGFIRHMCTLRIQTTASICIQRFYRGYRCREEAKFLRYAFPKIQGWVRCYFARKELKRLKELAKKRRTLLHNLRPLYEALHVLPAGTGKKRDRMIDQFILKDQIRQGEDQLCDEALEILQNAVQRLCTTCEERAAYRDTTFNTFQVTWKLLNVPDHHRINLPDEGEAGWISDAAIQRLDTEAERLREIKQSGLGEFLKEARAWCLRLWDEVGAQPSWRKNCKMAISKEKTMHALDVVLEEVGRMEVIKGVTVHLAKLLRRRRELGEKRVVLPTAQALIMDRSSGADKRKKQVEATRAMLDLEEPRTNRALYAVLDDLHKAKEELPIPLEKLQAITGFPELATLRAEIAESSQTQKEASEGNKMKKMGGKLRKAAQQVLEIKKNERLSEHAVLQPADVPDDKPAKKIRPPAGRPPSARLMSGRRSSMAASPAPGDSSARSGTPDTPGGEDSDEDLDSEVAQEKIEKKRRPVRKKKKREGFVVNDTE